MLRTGAPGLGTWSDRNRQNSQTRASPQRLGSWTGSSFRSPHHAPAEPGMSRPELRTATSSCPDSPSPNAPMNFDPAAREITHEQMDPAPLRARVRTRARARGRVTRPFPCPYTCPPPGRPPHPRLPPGRPPHPRLPPGRPPHARLPPGRPPPPRLPPGRPPPPAPAPAVRQTPPCVRIRDAAFPSAGKPASSRAWVKARNSQHPNSLRQFPCAARASPHSASRKVSDTRPARDA